MQSPQKWVHLKASAGAWDLLLEEVLAIQLPPQLFWSCFAAMLVLRSTRYPLGPDCDPYLWADLIAWLQPTHTGLPGHPRAVSNPRFPHQTWSWPPPIGQWPSLAFACPCLQGGARYLGLGLPGAPWLSCSWLGWWDRPWLPGSALMDPREPPVT